MPYKVRKVLVVDDNPTARTIASHIISRDRRFQVTAASDATEALNLIATECPDLVVLDNEMPSMTGIELLPLLRERCPVAKIVMWSLDKAVREQALAAGSAFVDKTDPLERLLDWLRDAA